MYEYSKYTPEARSGSQIRFEYFSECGPRSCNEDYVAFDKEKSIFVLCDGMGGHDGGAIASKVIADTIVATWHGDVSAACHEASAALNHCSQIDKIAEMGTTMAMASLQNDKLVLAHCGDSRIYHIRGGRIKYQSVDHVALTDIGNPIITRAFFTNSSRFTPDIHSTEIQSGDIIFMCSDGVYGNGKWSNLKDLLVSSKVDIKQIMEMASKDAFDNYSGIMITVE